MKRIILFGLLFTLPMAAQEIEWPAGFEALADQAEEVVNVRLDASMLGFASAFLSDEDADQARIKSLASGLQGIYVRSYEFAEDGQYSAADVEQIRSQLRPPVWNCIVSVRENGPGGESADVCLKQDGDQIAGLTILAAEPRELTVVQIVGRINLEDLAKLGGSLGIPEDIGESISEGIEDAME